MTTRTSTRPIALVDMDGVLFDLYAGVHRIARDTLGVGPDVLPLPPADELTEFRFPAVTPQAKAAMDAVMVHPDLFADLPPMPGAVQAIGEMAEQYDIIICSTPSLDNPTCASAKIDSLVRHFGRDIAKNAILTHDKTMVVGDILIDDKPDITGRIATPAWQQVVFDWSYNRDRTDLPRLTDWSNWRAVIEPILSCRDAA